MELELDLNELVSEKVRSEIDKLKQLNKVLREKNSHLNKELNKKDELIKNSQHIIKLIEPIKKEWDSLKPVKTDDGCGPVSVGCQKFHLIEKIMLNLFNIKPKYGRVGLKRDSKLFINLAANYYENKDLLINILIAFGESENDGLGFGNSLISKIKSFKMPWDWDRETIIKFVKNPSYNTNGCINGFHSYWNGKYTNVPHNFIMQSPYFLEDEVFNIALETIKNKRSSMFYTFFNTEICDLLTDSQIIDLGETLTTMTFENLKIDSVKKFIKLNINKFNKKTLDWLYKFCSSDNQFKVLDWQNFPPKYQMKYLESLSFDEVTKVLFSHQCKWTLEEKQDFLKYYLK